MDALYGLMHHDWFVSLERDGSNWRITMDPAEGLLYDGQAEAFDVDHTELRAVVEAACREVVTIENRLREEKREADAAQAVQG
jgi:hypothetical protein